MRRARKAALIAIGAAALVMTVTPAASAKRGHGGSSTGGTDEQDIYASVISYSSSNNGGGHKAGSLTPSGNFNPPACWYEPKYSPAQMKGVLEPIWGADSTGYEWDAKEREKYEGGKPYKDFNKEKDGKGMWWGSAVDHSRAGDPGFLACDKPYFWVDNGDTPPVDHAITPEMLAQLAYGRVRVPDTDVELSPANKQSVNLPTWAWLDKATFRPVSVTAAIHRGGFNMSATTTATPRSLKIEPGTGSAELHPASGECVIKDGRIGTPYTKGSGKKTPPCGLTYLRSNSGSKPYQFKATITWDIAWTGTGGTGGDLPSGTFGTTNNITVQEVQSVNR